MTCYRLFGHGAHPTTTGDFRTSGLLMVPARGYHNPYRRRAEVARPRASHL